MSVLRTLIIATALVSALPVYAGSPKARDKADESHLHSHVPLGIEGFFLRPSRRMLYVMSTADSPAFEGWRLLEQGAQKTVLDRNGARVRYYPERLHFRVTATTMLELFGVDSSALELKGNMNDFLRRLGFRLKIFHNLKMVTLQPESIEILGVPTDVSSEERVYRATFSMPPTPIEDRIMLEVLTPSGDRFCKFHLEF